MIQNLTLGRLGLVGALAHIHVGAHPEGQQLHAEPAQRPVLEGLVEEAHDGVVGVW